MTENLPTTVRLTLTALRLGDPPMRWEALGFTLADGCVSLGGVRLALGASEPGISAWSLPAVDGLRSFTPAGEPQPSAHPDPQPQPTAHTNGATGLDHLVVLSPDFDRTAAALGEAGIPLRRVREVPSTRDRPAFARASDVSAPRSSSSSNPRRSRPTAWHVFGGWW